MSNFYKELLQSGQVSVWGSVMSGNEQRDHQRGRVTA